jgi:hypothetical protein
MGSGRPRGAEALTGAGRGRDPHTGELGGKYAGEPIGCDLVGRQGMSTITHSDSHALYVRQLRPIAYCPFRSMESDAHHSGRGR